MDSGVSSLCRTPMVMDGANQRRLANRLTRRSIHRLVERWMGRHRTTKKYMGWKNIKEHYRIGHIVQVRDGKICIGSGYCPELIMVSFDGKVSTGLLGISSNEDLERYHAEMTADIGKLKQLLDAPDTFTASLPVYTYDGAEIIEKQCEAYGWPNCTHDGMIQYENSFSADKQQVVGWAKRNAELGVKYGKEHLERAEKEVIERRQHLESEVANLEKLEADYPSLNDRCDLTAQLRWN